MTKSKMVENEETENLIPERKKSVVREYVEAIIIALVLALFIRCFIIQAFKIPSGSMKNTLLVGDHILVSKFSYGIKIPNKLPFLNYKFFRNIRLFEKMPKRGDIIVFEFPMDQKRDFIKRVIGLPGDVFEVKAQNVYINGQLINEDYVIHQEPYRKDRALYPRDNYGPVVIPERALFMMGDNRENSQDSRYWSFLNMDLVKGRAFVIYWSWNSEDFNVRWNRISKLIK